MHLLLAKLFKALGAELNLEAIMEEVCNDYVPCIWDERLRRSPSLRRFDCQTTETPLPRQGEIEIGDAFDRNQLENSTF